MSHERVPRIVSEGVSTLVVPASQARELPIPAEALETTHDPSTVAAEMPPTPVMTTPVVPTPVVPTPAVPREPPAQARKVALNNGESMC